MDLNIDSELINGDFNLINEMSNDYMVPSQTNFERVPHTTELMFSIAYGKINSQINKPNRIDCKEKNSPWVYKKDRKDYIVKVQDDILQEEIHNNQVYLLRELEYQNYISEIEYPDTSSNDPSDYVKCYELNENSFINVLSGNTFNISNMFMEFESDDQIDVIDFINMMRKFYLGYIQFADRTLMNTKITQTQDSRFKLYNFIPDIICGLLEDYDFNPDLNKYLIKFSNTKFLQFRDNLQFSWDPLNYIFKRFKVKLYIYGKYITPSLYKSLYPKDYTNLCIDTYMTNSYIQNCSSDYTYNYKLEERYMCGYDQVLGFIFDSKHPNNHQNRINDDSISILDIDIIPNGYRGFKFTREDWVVIEFKNIKIYLIMLDPLLKDIKTFKSYLKGDIDYDHVSGINMQRIDSIYLKINLNTDNLVPMYFFNLGIGYIN